MLLPEPVVTAPTKGETGATVTVQCSRMIRPTSQNMRRRWRISGKACKWAVDDDNNVLVDVLRDPSAEDFIGVAGELHAAQRSSKRSFAYERQRAHRGAIGNGVSAA